MWIFLNNKFATYKLYMKPYDCSVNMWLEMLFVLFLPVMLTNVQCYVNEVLFEF